MNCLRHNRDFETIAGYQFNCPDSDIDESVFEMMRKHGRRKDRLVSESFYGPKVFHVMGVSFEEGSEEEFRDEEDKIK